LGIAVKIEDGTGRAAEVALGTALRAVQALSPAEEEALAPRFFPTLLNNAGEPVGEIRPCGATTA
jgi:L-asparaginase II